MLLIPEIFTGSLQDGIDFTGFEFEVCLYFMSQLRGCQTLDYNPTLYLLGIGGFQCRSYCMHAKLWHTTYCCTVADLASIFLNVKRFHCMCKLSTFLLTFFYNLTICIGKVSSVVNNCHAFTTIYLQMYVLCMLSHHHEKKKVNEENWTQIGLDRLCKS